MSRYEFGVVGLGVAGCFFIASLPDACWSRTVAYESGCIGGDLAGAWGPVVANLTRNQLAAAFRAIPRWSTDPLTILLEAEEDIKTCPRLSEVALQLQQLMKPILRHVTVYSQHVTEVRQELTGWCIMPKTHVAKLVVCTGGEPRALNYPRPSIPLTVALNPTALATCLQPAKDRVVVFGTAHSGSLVLRNLHDLGCSDVVAIWCNKAGVPPFRWARPHDSVCPCYMLGGTGCHDSEGLKQESAAIADAIVRGDWGPEATPRIIPLDDAEAVERAVAAADYLVYAVGFKGRAPIFKGLAGQVLEARHDPRTAQVAPAAWGFGIAFPSLYTKPRGTEAADVGLPAFAAHIQACLASILV